MKIIIIKKEAVFTTIIFNYSTDFGKLEQFPFNVHAKGSYYISYCGQQVVYCEDDVRPSKITKAVLRMQARQPQTPWSLGFDCLCLWSQNTHRAEILLTSGTLMQRQKCLFCPLPEKNNSEAPKISGCKKWNGQWSPV